jgi:hypothetical protein
MAGVGFVTVSLRKSIMENLVLNRSKLKKPYAKNKQKQRRNAMFP